MIHSATPEAFQPVRAQKGGFQASWLYRQLLKGPVPKGVRLNVAELWPGDPERGREMLTGQFRFQSESHHLTSAALPPTQASAEWLAWFHGHGWLTHLKALGGTDGGGEAPYFAREWVSTWMDANADWSHPAWTPAVAAERVINWVRAWDFLIRTDIPGPFDRVLRQSVGRDARHIFKSAPPGTEGFARLHTLKGQVFASLTLLGGDRCQQKALGRLEGEINAQVLPDGGHVERNPERLAQVLQDLLEVRSLCATALGQIPGFVQNAIDRAAPMLRALRHADGGLAVFNGGLEANPAWLDQLLGQTDPSTTPPLSAPYAGFQRLSAGAVALIMDCGKPATAGHLHHAGTLSFEMSVGKQRLIVNCGARTGESDPWRTALAATAAHSTLTINDTSSAAFALDGHLRRGPDSVTCERQDADEGTIIEASHDGYMNPFGLTHKRALFISPTGDNVRGEDRITGTGGQYFTVRFHLHPGVTASVLGGGAEVLLRFGTKDKEAWRLRASNGEIHLEESVYLGRAGHSRRMEQIVISGPLSGNGALVKWALSREGS